MEGSFGTVGPKEIQSACRSELSSIYYALLHLHRICILGNVQHGDITLHCDGLNAIQSIEKCTKDSFVTKNNFDIINSLNTLRRKMSLKINIAHISSHQD